MSTIRLIQDILEKNTTERPDKVALICEKRRLTYAQMDAMSNRLAHAFQQNGVQEGDRVLFYLLNGCELAVGIFAALKADAVFSVIDYANTFDTLRQIAMDSGAAALVTYGHQAEPAAGLLREQASLRLVVLAGKDSGIPGPGRLSFDAIQEMYPAANILRRRIDRDLAYLLYTSGSTGQSKGVMTTHRSSLSTVESGVEYFGLTEADIVTSPLPLSFSPGMNQLLMAFRVGATLILEQSFAYPSMTLKRMSAEGATGFAAVPTVLTIFLQNDLKQVDLSRLRFASSIGAALPRSVIERFHRMLPDVSLYSHYGMAEASFSLGLEPGQIDKRPDSVGKPFPGTQAWIESEDGRRLGPDGVGELVVRGNHVRSGYWNDPSLSERRFRPGALPGELVCYTGDQFRMDEDGYFYFIGRRDEIIKSGAKKVAFREIENALYSLPGVLEAAAIGIPDPVLGQVVKAFVVLDKKVRESLTVQDVLKHCHQRLEEFKVPRQIEIKDSLPKTPSGKIKKTDLV
jgi:long-chain acyl-CoA synthetase